MKWPAGRKSIQRWTESVELVVSAPKRTLSSLSKQTAHEDMTALRSDFIQ